MVKQNTSVVHNPIFQCEFGLRSYDKLHIYSETSYNFHRIISSECSPSIVLKRCSRMNYFILCNWTCFFPVCRMLRQFLMSYKLANMEIVLNYFQLSIFLVIIKSFLKWYSNSASGIPNKDSSRAQISGLLGQFYLAYNDCKVFFCHIYV